MDFLKNNNTNNKFVPQELYINPNQNQYSVKKKNFSLNSNKNDLGVVCWNIEDFVSINELYDSENPPFLNRLRLQDIIIIQEWKNTNFEGDLFLSKLNNKRLKYLCDFVDRVAIIYNKDIFDSTKTIVYKIPLAYEAPSTLEMTYTRGRQKYNMLTILFPKNKNKLPLAVVNCHLSAFSPQFHPGFHRRQLTGLLKNSLQKMKDARIIRFGVIIGGDTNYRNLGNKSDDLLGSLLSLNYNIPFENGKLRDVCRKKCLRTKTQSFGCVHEKGFAKKGMKFLRNNIYNRNSSNKNIPYSSINDNRLDFVATNLKIDYNYTQILKLCDFSDHSAILSRMTWSIDKTQNANSMRMGIRKGGTFKKTKQNKFNKLNKTQKRK